MVVYNFGLIKTESKTWGYVLKVLNLITDLRLNIVS